jgi:hypothetical protein
MILSKKIFEISVLTRIQNPSILSGSFLIWAMGEKRNWQIATRISFPFVSLYDAIEGRSTARTAASEVP